MSARGRGEPAPASVASWRRRAVPARMHQTTILHALISETVICLLRSHETTHGFGVAFGPPGSPRAERGQVCACGAALIFSTLDGQRWPAVHSESASLLRPARAVISQLMPGSAPRASCRARPRGRSKCQESAGSRGEEGGGGKFILAPAVQKAVAQIDLLKRQALG